MSEADQRWFNRYVELRKQGVPMTERIRILNEEFPEEEGSRVRHPSNQHIGPHAEPPEEE